MVQGYLAQAVSEPRTQAVTLRCRAVAYRLTTSGATAPLRLITMRDEAHIMSSGRTPSRSQQSTEISGVSALDIHFGEQHERFRGQIGVDVDALGLEQCAEPLPQRQLTVAPALPSGDAKCESRFRSASAAHRMVGVHEPRPAFLLVQLLSWK